MPAWGCVAVWSLTPHINLAHAFEASDEVEPRLELRRGKGPAPIEAGRAQPNADLGAGTTRGLGVILDHLACAHDEAAEVIRVAFPNVVPNLAS